MTEELKPCPFCGEQPEVGHYEIFDNDKWYIGCDCECGPCTKTHLTYEQAIAAWNARADTEYGWSVPATDENMAKYGWVRERTCRFIDDSDGEFPPKCSVCGYEPSIYECSWLGDGGYEFEGNYCPNCGARVIGTED